MPKRIFEPNTTLYPVAIILVTTGGEHPNVFTCNRIASVSAEPPRLAIAVRPNRYSHTLIRASGEFVVNIPSPAQQTLTDYLGSVTGREENKIAAAKLNLELAKRIKTPLLADCPVNIECIVEREIELDSHTLFIGLVQAVHADEILLDAKGDVDVARAQGLVYACGIVRERPTNPFNPTEFRQLVKGD
ncbi:MAG: flavin reductase family protein [Chloroflexi bacterium]|nr:flavin reductase family protein [Chloroflexota bacterium]